MPAIQRNILIAGDSATGLPEVCGELAQLAPQWRWQHAATGVAALNCLTSEPVDAIVADLRLVDLSGLQLLNQVMTQWPRTHRVIVADLGDLDALLRCVGGLHQFLALPCEAERLLTVLQRAFELDLWLPNQTVRKLLGRLPSLPSLSADHYAAIRALDQNNLDQAAATIAADPPLAAKILQLSNSAAWGPPLDEADPDQAAHELGLSNLRRTLLLAHACSSYRDVAAVGFEMDAFLEHARQTSRLARSIAQAETAPDDVVRQAATAGLLHNLGKLALAVNLPEKHRAVVERCREDNLATWEAEQVVFRATHGEVGGSLLAVWGLPMPVIVAVAFHHHPTCMSGQSFSALTAVHVANVLVNSENLEMARERLDLGYLTSIGVEHRLDDWWKCRSDLQSSTPKQSE